MKKILIDLTPFAYGRAAGYNEFVLLFLDGLIENLPAHLEFYLLIRADQNLHFRPYGSKFRIIEIFSRSVISRILFQNFFFLKKEDFDFYLFMANFAPPLLRRPYLLVTHDLVFKSHPGNFSRLGCFLRKNISRSSIKRAKISVAISKITATEIADEFGVDSLVIYNPVRAKFKVNSKSGGVSKKIICMSSLASHKNIDSAYKACISFAENFPDVSFDFIGNWRVEEFPSNIRHPNVRLHGYVSNELKAELLNDAICILAPSVYEGFGMPYAEAMILKKSLICSRIPISEEISMQYPYYIDYPFGVDQIYNALAVARCSDFLSGYVDAGHVEKFTPKTSSKIYLDAVENYLNSVD